MTSAVIRSLTLLFPQERVSTSTRQEDCREVRVKYEEYYKGSPANQQGFLVFGMVFSLKGGIGTGIKCC